MNQISDVIASGLCEAIPNSRIGRPEGGFVAIKDGAASSPNGDATAPRNDTTRPRLGFLGVGWIGRNRLEHIAKSGIAEIAVIAEPVRELAMQAAQIAPGAEIVGSLEPLLEARVDGIVIATPSALHTEQAVAALENGIAVFCQKPLGRNSDETCRVVDAAHAANRLLSVDLSYRFTTGMQKIRELIRQDDL